MRNLIKFIGLYNYSLTFIALIFLSFFFLFNQNFVLKTFYFNSSNFISGTFYSLNKSVQDYFYLKETNRTLTLENKKLKKNFLDLNLSKDISGDSSNVEINFIAAEVINNSVNKTKNYITINRGSKHGIKEGMGVLSSSGVVGRVKYVSNNFSTVISVLNTSFFLSTIVKETNTICSINWDGSNPNKVKLLYVPKHININRGYIILTSSFDSIYPKGIEVGIVDSVNKNVNSNFYEIDITLSQDFYNLSSVYIIKEELSDEKLSLEKITNDEK